jgi:hypothetical protein
MAYSAELALFKPAYFERVSSLLWLSSGASSKKLLQELKEPTATRSANPIIDFFILLILFCFVMFE